VNMAAEESRFLLGDPEESGQATRGFTQKRSAKKALSCWAKWNSRRKTIWYTPSGLTLTFFIVEFFKLSIATGTYYGVFTFAEWWRCGLPSSSEKATCDVNYNDLHKGEYILLGILAIVTFVFRQKRRQATIHPNQRFFKITMTGKLEDFSGPCDFSLTEELIQYKAADTSGKKEEALVRITSKLVVISEQVDAMNNALEIDKQFKLRNCGYHYINEAIRAAIFGFFALNIILQFYQVVATLSNDDAYVWTGHPLKDLPILVWPGIFLATIAAMLTVPDDLTAQNNDLKTKLWAQYNRLEAGIEERKRSIIKVCESALSVIMNKSSPGKVNTGVGAAASELASQNLFSGESVNTMQENIRVIRTSLEGIITACSTVYPGALKTPERISRRATMGRG
jgi:hypothetical protein